MTQHLPIAAQISILARELQAHGVTYEDAVTTFAAQFVREAFAACGGETTRTARRLGVHRNTAGNLRRRFGIAPARKERNA